MTTRIGEPEVSYTSRGLPTFRVELWHDGLRKHREIKGRELAIVQRKVVLQVAEWEERWSMTQERESRQDARAAEREHRESQKELAAERSRQAQAELENLEHLLAQTLDVDDTIDWTRLKDVSAFSEPIPEPPPTPTAPRSSERPARPEWPSFEPTFTFLDRVLAGRRRRKVESAQAELEAAQANWKTIVSKMDSEENARAEEHRIALEQHKREAEKAMRAWDQRRVEFEGAQRDSNEAVERQKASYESGQGDAIVEYCDMVLSNSEYPDWMPNEWQLDYRSDSRTLVVEYMLPSVDQMPTISDVRYIQSRDEVTERSISDAQLRKLYDSVVYQIVLRTVHELFEADAIDAIDAIVFNGRVTSIDRTTGHETTACIVSMHVGNDEFAGVNLASVDPKACFKALKGVGSSRLHSLTAVAPILEMRREDGRFVSAREVANSLDESANLAAMDWEEFEHLIRELFEQEFAAGGGDVKVTQASRDGGVDAIAFDPDPIRGGKIVIQAKRYTNTVGVAAVRDLYGTVMNEGATKGILVTTSDYGPDAYSFAKDKPITLLSGANLLHLLEKHGHRARIDIADARRQLRDVTE